MRPKGTGDECITAPDGLERRIPVTGYLSHQPVDEVTISNRESITRTIQCPGQRICFANPAEIQQCDGSEDISSSDVGVERGGGLEVNHGVSILVPDEVFHASRGGRW